MFVFLAMACIKLILCVCVCAWVGVGVARRQTLPDEQRLFKKLFATYSTDVRPVYNSSDNVIITFNFNLIQVLDMVSKMNEEAIVLNF